MPNNPKVPVPQVVAQKKPKPKTRSKDKQGRSTTEGKGSILVGWQAKELDAARKRMKKAGVPPAEIVKRLKVLRNQLNSRQPGVTSYGKSGRGNEALKAAASADY